MGTYLQMSFPIRLCSLMCPFFSALKRKRETIIDISIKEILEESLSDKVTPNNCQISPNLIKKEKCKWVRSDKLMMQVHDSKHLLEIT